MKVSKIFMLSTLLVLGGSLLIQAQSPTERSQTQSNMKQIALATIIYSADYDLVLPAVTSTRSLAYCIRPYLKSLEPWRPVGKVPGVTVFNLSLAGADTNRADIRPTWVLFYQSMPYADGARSVAQLDGTVKDLNAKSWEQARNDLRSTPPKGASKMLPKNWGFAQIPADFQRKR